MRLATLALLALLALLVAPPVVAQEPAPESPLFRGLGRAFLVLDAVDLAQTAYMGATGDFTERNPLLRPVFDKPGLLALTKVGYAWLMHWLTAKVYPDHPKLALVVRIALVASYGAVVALNARELHQYHAGRPR